MSRSIYLLRSRLYAPIAVGVAVSTQRHQDAQERTGRVRRALHGRNLDV